MAPPPPPPRAGIGDRSADRQILRRRPLAGQFFAQLAVTRVSLFALCIVPKTSGVPDTIAWHNLALKRDAFVDFDGVPEAGAPSRSKRAKLEVQPAAPATQPGPAPKTALDVLGPLPAITDVKSGKVRATAKSGGGGSKLIPKHLLR